MAQVTLGGKPVQIAGELPKTGATAPDFQLVRTDLSEVNLSTFSGKRKVLNIFPSVDTPTCATSVRRFNQEAAKMNNTVVLNVSMDLPFAQKRFCGTEGITNAEALSAFRSNGFAEAYGLRIADSALKGLLARAVVVIDENNKVVHTELVPEIANEPSYENAMKVLK